MDWTSLRAWLQFLEIRQFLQNNNPMKLIIILAIVCVMAIIARFLCGFLRKRIEKLAEVKSASVKVTGENEKKASPQIMDKAQFEQVMRDAGRLLTILIVFWGFRQIDFGAGFNSFVLILFMALSTLMAIKFVNSFVPFNIDLYFRRRGSTLQTSQSRSLMPIIKGLIWAIGLTFMLDNIGFHVSTIIAGLGIVGVAVGLAGQAILSDFFSYIVILLDKPFRIGDFVVLSNGKSGEVVYIGPKNVRLRSLENNLIVCANTEMTKGMLINQGSVELREVVVEVGVAYTVPIDHVRKVPEILREVVESFPQCEFERAAMTTFGTANYIFQLIYHVKPQPGGLVDFMKTQTDVNLAFTEKLNSQQLNGAYPTQSIQITNVTPPVPQQPQKDQEKAA